MRQLLQDRMIRVLLACILLLSWQPGLYAVELRGYPSSPTFSGIIKAGSTPVTLTDSAGKVLSAALNTVAVAQGGTGVTTSTGTGAVVLGTGPTLASPIITNIAPAADFTLTQNSIAALTSVNAAAVVNTLYLKAGQVALGHSSPLFPLHMKGAGTTTLMVEDAAGPTQISVVALDTFGVLGTVTNHPMYLVTNNLARMFLDTSGNVSLGSAATGTSAATVFSVPVGTAPTTFPAAVSQMVVVNALGANTAGFKLFGEKGDSHHFGNNHYSQHQVTKPTVSATNCGTTPAIENGSSDQAFRLTVDFTGVAACVVTFNTSTTNVMKCVSNNETTANLMRATAAAGQVTLAGTVVTGDKITVLCGDSL